jgi:hypothetical protein
MTPGQILAVILLAMAISAGGTWQVQDWRMGKRLAEQAGLHQGELDRISAVAIKQVRDEQDRRLGLEKTLATSDQTTHPRTFRCSTQNISRLLDRLATTDVRLSVLLDATDSASGCNVPATTSAAGVVHAARRAQLDPAHAQRIIAITDEGDRGLIALRACQAYVRAVCVKLDRMD